jgi:hypothetical protein
LPVKTRILLVKVKFLFEAMDLLSQAHFGRALPLARPKTTLARSPASYKSPAEINLMRALKVALDPLNLLNPGKLLAGSDRHG